MCFQDNSLFPHFNVIENINIGAKRKNGSKFNYSDKDLIKILHLEDIQEKYPHQISSGRRSSCRGAHQEQSGHRHEAAVGAMDEQNGPCLH